MLADVRSAFSFLTIIPLGFDSSRKLGWTFTWYPIVGLAIGAILFAITYWSPFSEEITAFLVLLTWVIITGGLHLDGFGDSCDGLFASVDAERRLEIMKDPRAGSWAVIGLVLLLLGKFVALSAVPAIQLILPPIIGRWVIVLAVWYFPYARDTGIGGVFQDGLGLQHVLGATLLAVVVSALVVRQIAPIAVVVIVVLAMFLVGGAWSARRLGGGHTGDIYGALCEITEFTCLLGLTGLALWANI